MATIGAPAPIPGENVILKSDNGVLMLTNFRVKYDAAGSGASQFVSIPLDSVASCGLVTRSLPILLAIAAILFIGALAQAGQSASYGLAAVGALFVVGYFSTRRGVITVASNGGESISVPARGMSRDSILVFVEAVMTQKLRFLGRITG